MKTKLFNISVVIMFLVSNIFAAKIPKSVIKDSCSDIRDILSVVNKRSLVAFDFDHVIAKNKNAVGGDTWFSKMFSHIMSCGFTSLQAKSKLLPLYISHQMASEVELTSADVKNVIETLQNHGITVIIATSRNLNLVDTTIRQIESLGIDMTKTMLSPETFNNFDSTKFVCQSGVLFCNGADKGDCLFALIGNNQNYTGVFDSICFVDDSLYHVNSVQKFAEKMGLNYFGFRYNIMDEFARSYQLDNDSLDMANQMSTALRVELKSDLSPAFG
jgi:biotin operon repressor